MAGPALQEEDFDLNADQEWLAEHMGHYEIRGEIARGGMSRVLLAWDRTAERKVALKLLAQGFAASIEGRERFRREALITTRNDHPHIVPCYEFVSRANRAAAVMRYIPGDSLADRLTAGAPIHPAALLTILIPIADALAHVHRRGVIHRDVKPANILLHAEDGWPFLTDFGIATLRTSDYSRFEATRQFGTPEFMSPEQALGAWDADHRSDIYSFGLVAWVGLTGVLPFHGSPLAQAGQRAAIDVPPLHSRAPQVPRRVAEVVDRCLARDPRKRWGDAGTLHRALAKAARRMAA